MFKDPTLALIGAIGVVIKILITTVLYSVEIVAYICIARIIVVLICFLPPILLLFLPHQLLSLFKLLWLPFLINTINQFRYLLHNPSTLPTLKHSSILHTPMASSIIRRAKLFLMAPLPIRPIPLEAIELMLLRYPSESLSTDSREFISNSVLTYRCRHQIANRHGAHCTGQNAGSFPVQSFPSVRHNLSLHHISSHWISTLG